MIKRNKINEKRKEKKGCKNLREKRKELKEKKRRQHNKDKNQVTNYIHLFRVQVSVHTQGKLVMKTKIKLT